MRLARGSTRWTLLVGRWALKFPRPPVLGWYRFLWGLIANSHESRMWRWSRMDREEFPNGHRYCPVLWSLPGGFLNVMPRVKTLTNTDGVDWTGPLAGVEHWKPDSWGWLEGRIVAVDYGDGPSVCPGCTRGEP